MRYYRTKLECSVVCTYGKGRPFAEFNQKRLLDALWGLEKFTKTENKSTREWKIKHFK